jgi:hypothetical protein
MITSQETIYLQLQQPGSMLVFECIAEHVNFIALNVAPESPYPLTEEILTNFPEEAASYFTVKKSSIPYTGEREKIIVSLQEDGFKPSTHAMYQNAEKIYRQIHRST